MQKFLFLILVVFLLIKCVAPSYVGPSYISKQKNKPFGNEYHVLQLDYGNNFQYIYFNKAGTIHEEVNGDYEIINDSLILKVIEPVEFKIKKTYVEYSYYGSRDSVYLMFFNMYPKILEVNRYKYNKASLRIFFECPNDTCPSYHAVESNMLPGGFFKDTVIVSKEFYNEKTLDTLKFFDPNDDLLNKQVPINLGQYNCAKIFLAVKPNNELYKIPKGFSFKGRNIIYSDSINHLIIFRPYDHKYVIKK
jgi:hypothetical protein